MKAKIIELKPFQEDFVYSKLDFPCFAGGWGSGKSLALCIKLYFAAKQYDNNFLLLGRQHFTDLRDSTLKDFIEWFGNDPSIKINYSSYSAKFNNGSEIIFRYLDNPKGIKNLNLGGFGVDQAEEISEDIFNDLVGRIRRKGIPNRFGAIVCNTEGHNWIWKRWKDKLESQHLLVEATTLDNRDNLDRKYIENILALPEQVKNRYVFNSWEAFEGLIFSELSENIHRINGFEIPKGWHREESMDYGLVNPTCFLWSAIDYDGNIYIYDEHYKAGETIGLHAKAVLDKRQSSIFGGTKQQISISWADPSIFAKQQKNNQPYSIAEEYEENNIILTPANNEVLAGINKIKQYLTYQLDSEGNFIKRPQLYFFKNCENLWRELTDYQWKKIKGDMKERPQETNNHAIDTLRYLINARPTPTARPQEKKRPEIWEIIDERRDKVQKEKEGYLEEPKEEEIEIIDKI